MAGHSYYSHRAGTNPNLSGLPLEGLRDLFIRVFGNLRGGGYFDEAFGFTCVDDGPVRGTIEDVELQLHLEVRKPDLWPIDERASGYSEDDLFDVIEFLYQHVSKPIEGTPHPYLNCGMHWETFNQADGRTVFRAKINAILELYVRPFELSPGGEILHRPEEGFEPIFAADLPTSDENILTRVHAATLLYRRHGSTLDDRRSAVRDLADVLEYLRPKMNELITARDEKDLFNLANNFGIRHHNDKQKTKYDAAIWLSWMFYYYLATIHVILRKTKQGNSPVGQGKP